MITYFVILVIYAGQVSILQGQQFPTYKLCEAHREVIYESIDQFGAKTICVQSEIILNEGEENAIYHQASTTN